jgi:hypothetical protein
MKVPKPTDPEDESAWRVFFKACQRHHESLKGRVPEHALALLNLEGVDDGLLVAADYQRAERALKIMLRCGHLQMGYYRPHFAVPRRGTLAAQSANLAADCRNDAILPNP